MGLFSTKTEGDTETQKLIDPGDPQPQRVEMDHVVAAMYKMGGSGLPLVDDVLPKYAECGWELVTVTYSGEKGSNRMDLFFQRPVLK